MANLDNLNIASLTEMSNDEALEVLRQIRLSRRTPTKPPKSVTTRQAAKATPKVSDEQAAELLKLLMGE